MTEKCLISVISTNKNDNYHSNQLLRTKFILNYFLYSIRKINAVGKIEYILVDWGSEKSFSNFFHEEISDCQSIKFINIPKEETDKCKLSFDTSKALNIGINNSVGEFVILTSPDQFFTTPILNNLLNFLTHPKSYGLTGDEYKLVPRKILKNDFFIYQSSFDDVETHLMNLHHSSLPFPKVPLNGGGGAGGNLIKKKILMEIGGIKDTQKYNLGQDLVILQETSNNYSHLDTETFGIYLLKLPRSILGDRRFQLQSIKNPLNYLKFSRNEKIINNDNIEIINNSNPPKTKLFIEEIFSEKRNNYIGMFEIIRNIIDCTYISNFFHTYLTNEDIKFIIKIKALIEDKKILNIIFDKTQAIRFIICLARKFPSTQFLVFLDSKENNPLDVLKFRNSIVNFILHKNFDFYGNIRILIFNKNSLNMVNKFHKNCIIQEKPSNSFSNFRDEIKLYEISTLRNSISNNKKIEYEIVNSISATVSYNKFFTSRLFVNFIIFTYTNYRKYRIFLGEIKKKIIKGMNFNKYE